jgi:histidinol-phosphate aminotransferase
MTADDPGPAMHGGPDASGPAPHDFSTNGNGCGPCPAVLSAVQAADPSRYPDPGYTALREALASFHGVAAGRVVVAASASEFIHRISAAVTQAGGRRVWLPAQSYGDCERAARAWGLEVVRAPTATGEGADLLWACEPSSPLGQAQADLGSMLGDTSTSDDAQRPRTWVLDLAYAPLRLEGRCTLDQVQRDRVWQLWTPNKAMGLTGIRAAYAIAPADLHGVAITPQQLDALAPSWPIGAHGIALLQAWVGAEAQRWLMRSREILRGWKTSQHALCESLGWTCLPSDANFFCAGTDLPYPPLAAELRAAGIKLRDCASFGLPGMVRLGVLPPASQQALARAWARVVS